jgi:alpha-L-arabinofuranosidase
MTWLKQGEYAAISTNPNDIFGSTSDGRLSYPTMQSTAGEAGESKNIDLSLLSDFLTSITSVHDRP